MNENELPASTVRWAGLAEILGGALFVVSAVLITCMPRGYISDECAVGYVLMSGKPLLREEEGQSGDKVDAD